MKDYSYIPNWTFQDITGTSSWGLISQYMGRVIRSGSRKSAIKSYTHGITASAGSYWGFNLAVNGKLYFLPCNQTQAYWHYIDTDDTIKEYAHTASIVAGSYFGGVLRPDGRIYLVPRNQAGQNFWHYIDTTKTPGSAGHVVAYSRWTGSPNGANFGGVLGVNGNVYFVPYNIANRTQWCYINTSGTPLGYSHGITALNNGYVGGCLAPDGKIYLAPYSQATATVWHYIDSTITPGSAGCVVAYTHGVTTVDGAYYGAVLAPDDKIYLLPFHQSTATVWHYIDTTITPGSAGHVVAYTHGASVTATGYAGGSLAPDGKIYLTPNAQSTAAVWHYIDTTKTPGTVGHVVAYSHNSTGITGTYVFGSVVTTNGRIYLTPSTQGTATVWHYIQTRPNVNFQKNLVLSPYMNKM